LLDYLKAAFWYKPHIWGLGSIPVNFLALIGFAVLGFGHPAFWLLGLGLEAAYLFALASNDAFQRWVQLQEQMFEHGDEEAERQGLIRYLSPDAHDRLQSFENKCKRIIELQIVAKAEESVLSVNRLGLRELMWVYLKLLVAEHSLHKPESGKVEHSIRREIEALESNLGKGDLPDSVRESKTATLEILRKRLRNIERRDQYLAETQSNLKRIEAQIDLALDKAEMKGRPQFISTDIEVAGDLLSDLFYGDADAAIAEIEGGVRAKESALAATKVKQ
jgi:hypothetical protein